MKVIGLTGVFGSGKSTISRVLRSQGFKVIEADRIGHSLLLNSKSVRKELLKIFGTTEREALAKIVFNDKKKLKELNSTMHPVMKKKIAQEIKRTKNVKGIVIEAAVFIEMALAELVDEVWLVTANKASILNRMSKKYSRQEILKRLKNASSIKRMKNVADKIIKNDASLSDLLKTIKSLA